MKKDVRWRYCPCTRLDRPEGGDGMSQNGKSQNGKSPVIRQATMLAEITTSAATEPGLLKSQQTAAAMQPRFSGNLANNTARMLA